MDGDWLEFRYPAHGPFGVKVPGCALLLECRGGLELTATRLRALPAQLTILEIGFACADHRAEVIKMLVASG